MRLLAVCNTHVFSPQNPILFRAVLNSTDGLSRNLYFCEILTKIHTSIVVRLEYFEQKLNWFENQHVRSWRFYQNDLVITITLLFVTFSYSYRIFFPLWGVMKYAHILFTYYWPITNYVIDEREGGGETRGKRLNPKGKEREAEDNNMDICNI